MNSHNDRKIYGAKLLLKLITILQAFLIHFRCNFIKKYFIKLISHSLSTHPCERILNSPGVTMIAYCDRRMCAWCSLAFQEKTHYSLMASRYGIIMRCHCNSDKRDFAIFVFEQTYKCQPHHNLSSHLILQRLCREAALSPGIDAFW